MTVNKTIVGAIVVLAILGFMWVPASHASSVTAKLSPSTNSANVTAYVNTTVTVSTNNNLSKLLALVYYALSSNYSISKTFSNNSEIFIYVQNALQNKDSNLSLNYLNISYQRVHNILNSTSMEVSYFLRIQLNVTGVFTGSTANLAWRAFNSNQSMNISSGNDINHVSYADNQAYQNGTLNFTAFKTSMTSWERSYDSSTNITTFKYDAGTTLNTSFKWKNNSTGYYLNISIVRDPSFSIITPGYAVAGSNTISVQSVPANTTPSKSPWGVVIIAAILIGGLLISMRLRRRKSH